MPHRPCSIGTGDPWPLGATPGPSGVNFALYSAHATKVELVLFEEGPWAPPRVIDLDPRDHRTHDCWHCFLPEARPGLCYAWRVDGPDGPWHRFDRRQFLLDPYGRAREAHCSVVCGTLPAAPRPARCAPWDRVIYEAHVKGFTRHPSSGVRAPGTYAGFIEKLDHLVDLGVTTLQLMPLFEWDPEELGRVSPITGEPLVNYWGYNPIGFFAPHPGFARQDAFVELRELVQAAHDRGLEVFLDVVYNHTAEGDDTGPTWSLRGIDNATYYLPDPKNPATYANYSGVGNSVNANHPAVRALILDSLRYWVQQFGFDGFRFDLASVLTRGPDGEPMAEPPLIWEIENDPVLRDVTVIAEAWDAAGLYHVGSFPGSRWGEWNGAFRDDIRRFVRGDKGLSGRVAARLTGSSDLYLRQARLPHQGVNYVACHDGFPVRDVVTWARKYNLANGENNRDGSDWNHSHNYGVEGPTADPAIQDLRDRQVRNLLALLFLAHGTPMLRMGDELGHTQHGNNNAYCQDNAISWLDWGGLRAHAALYELVRGLIALRRAHPNLRPRRFSLPPGNAPQLDRTIARWHGLRLDVPDWSPNNHLLSYTLEGRGDPLHVLVNMGLEPCEPALPDLPWRRVLDTSLVPSITEPVAVSGSYPLAARSVVLLVATSAREPGASLPSQG